MGDQSKNISIGIFSLAAIAAIISVLFFLNPGTGDNRQIIKVRFGNIDKVNTGTRVNYGGKAVGEVTAIEPIAASMGHPFQYKGEVYVWELTLKVDSHIPVSNNDLFELRTSGLLGEKSVSITPRPLQLENKDETVSLAEENSIKPNSSRGKIIFGEVKVKKEKKEDSPSDVKVFYASETAGVEETLKEFQGSAQKLNRLLDSTYEIVDALNKKKFSSTVDHTLRNIEDITSALNKPEKLDKLLDNVEKTSHNLEEITASVNKPQELSEVVDNLHLLSQRINASWDNVDKAIEKFADAAHSFNTFSLTTNTVIENVSKGEGSIGQLVVKDDLYLQLSSILSKAETIMDDINHYGILFHLDKGWQKLRARRANLLQKLSTPQEFRNYFNDEVDQITTSLSRVYMVLKKIEESQGCFSLYFDPEYSKVFAELLRRTSTLEENLQMYNQQAIESIVEKTELRDWKEIN